MYHRKSIPVYHVNVTQYFKGFAQTFVVLQDLLEVQEGSGTETPVH